MQKHYDKVPTQGSTNPVKSDGLAQQLTQIGLKLGDLTQLKTSAKTSAVAAVNEVNEKVSNIASGKYYGFYKNESELPASGNENGYAYVGATAPYSIYNGVSNGGTMSWTDSGSKITNASIADEEDITQDEGGELQFKDRGTASGKGYVILRSNKSFASQVDKEDTIYEIRYDFALTADVALPSGCTLKFNGGKISGAYTLTGNYTTIEAPLYQILDSVLLRGTFNKEMPVEWFGADASAASNQNAINYAIAQLTNLKGGGTLIFNYAYTITDTIYIRDRVSFRGVTTSSRTYNSTHWETSAIRFNFDNNPEKWVIDIRKADLSVLPYYQMDTSSFTDGDIFLFNVGIHNLAIYNIGTTWAFGGIRIRRLMHESIENVAISGVYVGMNISYSWDYKLENVTLNVNKLGLYIGDTTTTFTFDTIDISRSDSISSSTTKVSIVPNFEPIAFKLATGYDSTLTTETQADTCRMPYLEGADVSTGIFAEGGAGTFINCVIEPFGVMIEGYDSKLFFLNPYIETSTSATTYSIAYCASSSSGDTWVNIINPSKTFYRTESYMYGAAGKYAKIILDNGQKECCDCWSKTNDLKDVATLHHFYIKNPNNGQLLYYDTFEYDSTNGVTSKTRNWSKVYAPFKDVYFTAASYTSSSKYLVPTLRVGSSPISATTLDEILERSEYNDMIVHSLTNSASAAVTTTSLISGKRLTFNKDGGNSSGTVVYFSVPLRVANCEFTFNGYQPALTGSNTAFFQIEGDCRFYYNAGYVNAHKWFVLGGKGNYTVYLKTPYTLGSAALQDISNVITNYNTFTSPFIVHISATNGEYEYTNPSRPTTNVPTGYRYFDTTLGKYICWNGNAWVNMDGTSLSSTTA
jgi:hypothetical protein